MKKKDEDIIMEDEKKQNEDKSFVIDEDNFPEVLYVKFFTSTFPHSVGIETYEVPSHLSRYGLSEIVNALLTEKSKQNGKKHQIIPFEFLVKFKEKKIFLRTSLKKFFIKIQQWPEEVVILEYVQTQPAPKVVDEIKHDDWVSRICHLEGNKKTNLQDYVVSGCYDGILRIWDGESLNFLGEHNNERSISDIDVLRCENLKGEQTNDFFMLCSGKSEFAYFTKYHQSTQSVSTLMKLKGHAEKVNCVKIMKNVNLLLTGGSDKLIKCYSMAKVFQNETKKDFFEEMKEDEDDKDRFKSPPKKRKKETVVEQKEFLSLNGHRLKVDYLDGDKNVIVSGSADHTIKIWDMEKNEVVQTFQGAKVVSSISYKSSNGVVLSSHPDYLIRMWDQRVGFQSSEVFKSHNGWVRDVQWNKSNEFQFLSCGDDNLIKVWDVRSAIPLHSILHHVEKKEEEKESTPVSIGVLRNPVVRNKHKVLCVEYQSGEGKKTRFFSGSTDCILKRHSM